MAEIPDHYDTIVFRPNSWVQQDQHGPFVSYQAKGTFAPNNAKQAVRDLLEKLAASGPRVSKRRFPRVSAAGRNHMLEVSIPDLHLGMNTFKGEADHDWNMDLAASTFMWAIEELLRMTSMYHVEMIVFPIGNDYLNVDTPTNTTTKGTPQPESSNWHQMFRRGADLLVEGIDRLKQVAPVRVIAIPGNHDYNSSIHMSYVIEAYYRNDKNVHVNATLDPYKFVEYGVSLIGFDHGAEIEPVRLAALMANEQREAWARTKFHEWHLADQHRKSAKFMEQGVGVEYIPSLTAPNGWHRKKSFNHQRRAALAFLWNKVNGPVSRLQVNIDPFTGRPMT